MKNNLDNINFWKRGKIEQANFYSINLKRKTNLISFIFGLVFSAILLLPFIFMLIQFAVVFSYNFSFFVLYLTVAWVLLMIFNGLSNYITVKIAQASVKDMVNLQAIKPKYILLYQCLNIGFGIVSLILIVIFGIRLLGV